MADSAHPRIRLGIMRVLGESLSVFFRRFPLFFMIAVIPAIVLALIGGVVAPPQFEVDTAGEFGVGWQYNTAPGLLLLLVNMLVFIMVLGVTAMAAYDSLSDRPVRIGVYLQRCLVALPAIVVLGLLFYLVMIFGMLFLFLPGLYLAARYGVFVPAILIDRAGFSGLGRAASLTQGYRWPIVGGLLLLLLVYVGLSTLSVLLVGLVAEGFLGAYGFGVIQAVSSAVINAFSAVFTALLYARLREIKEGLGIRDLVEVFA